MPTKSNQMKELYGEQVSQRVFDRIQDLDPELNLLIQQIAYDVFWAREGLSVKEKSIVTILTLFALQKEEQSRIHLNGFFNSKGSANEAFGYLESISSLIGEQSSHKAIQAINEVISSRGMSGSGNLSLQEMEVSYAKLIVHAARGNLPSLKTEIQKFINTGGNVETLRGAFIHMIVYAGFPTAMNAFAVLKDLQD